MIIIEYDDKTPLNISFLPYKPNHHSGRKWNTPHNLFLHMMHNLLL